MTRLALSIHVVELSGHSNEISKFGEVVGRQTIPLSIFWKPHDNSGGVEVAHACMFAWTWGERNTKRLSGPTLLSQDRMVYCAAAIGSRFPSLLQQPRIRKFSQRALTLALKEYSDPVLQAFS